MSVNKAILIGRVGKDPEVKHLDNNRTVANFSLATSETYKDKDGKKHDSVEWHSVVIWGKLAELVEKYVHRGDMVCVIGKITTRSWEDKDGNKRYTTEIVCGELKMLGGKKSEDKSEIPVERKAKLFEPDIDDDDEQRDDLPF